MNALATTQDRMREWLLHGVPAIVAHVVGDDAASRLRIYADAYRLRLIEVLGNDFPITKATLGGEAFDALAFDYLQAHPSTNPSARHFGHAFADWLAAQRDPLHPLSQLARFEWAQGECFDATDASSLGIDPVAALPAEAWPALRLRLHPAVRLLTVACNAADILEAGASDAPLPELRAEAAASFVLWRCGGDVHWRRLDTDEARALHAIASGETFASLCERLETPRGDGARRAASLLKRWLTDGLLASF